MEWKNTDSESPAFGQRVMVIYKVDETRMVGIASYQPVRSYASGESIHIFLLDDSIIPVSAKFWFAIPEMPADA